MNNSSKKGNLCVETMYPSLQGSALCRTFKKRKKYYSYLSISVNCTFSKSRCKSESWFYLCAVYAREKREKQDKMRNILLEPKAKLGQNLFRKVVNMSEDCFKWNMTWLIQDNARKISNIPTFLHTMLDPHETTEDKIFGQQWIYMESFKI